MTSKERVLRTINGYSVDRVPTGIFGTSRKNEERLRESVKANSIEDLYLECGIDIWHLNSPLVYQGNQRYYNGKPCDFWGITDTAYADGDSSNECPLKDVSSVEEVLRYEWPNIDDFVPYNLDSILDDHAYFAIDGGLSSPIFHNMVWLCGFETTLINIKLQPEVVKEILRKITDFWVAYAKKTLSFAKGRIDIMQNCNDFGTQISQIVAPDDFREFIKPELKRIYDTIKDFDVKVMQHSCGSISPIIDDFIDMGVDILNPIQVSATNMDIDSLAKKYAGKITLYGGIDTQVVLPTYTEEKVRKITQKTLKTFEEKGGFILGPSQGVEDDIPPENIFAMLGCVKKNEKEAYL